MTALPLRQNVAYFQTARVKRSATCKERDVQQLSGSRRCRASVSVCQCVFGRCVCACVCRLCALFFNLLRAHNKSLLLSFSSNCYGYDCSSRAAPATPTACCQLFNAHGEFANVTCQCVRAGKISQRQRGAAAVEAETVEAQVLGLC